MSFVTVPRELVERLADDDWSNSVPDDFRPMMATQDGSYSPATFTVGDLRELRGLLERSKVIDAAIAAAGG